MSCSCTSESCSISKRRPTECTASCGALDGRAADGPSSPCPPRNPQPLLPISPPPLRRREEAPEPYSGLLLKRANVVKDWRKRYFEIHVRSEEQVAELRYFQDACDAKPKGRLSLRGATIADSRLQNATNGDFVVTASDGEEYVLRAHTPAATAAWKRELLEAQQQSLGK